MRLVRSSQHPSQPNKYRDINFIRRSVLSFTGPSESGTRLVVLAILDHAGPGGVAWPSQKRLAECTAMSVRSVRTYLNAAERQHWISRYRRRVHKGQQWYQTIYLIHTPEQAAEIAASTVDIKEEANLATQSAQIAY